MKILIIEDSGQESELITESLRNLNADIRHATHLKSAISEIESFTPDFIILDLDLIDSTRKNTLKNIGLLSKSSCLMVFSGYTTSEDEKFAFDQGADNFLNKGALIDKDQFMDNIHQAWNHSLPKLRKIKDTSYLDKITHQISAPDPIKELHILRKQGNRDLSQAVMEKAMDSPIDAQLLLQGIKLGSSMSEIKSIMDQVLEQDKIQNLRLEDIESWRSEVEAIEEKRKEIESIRAEAKNLLKIPFRIGWKLAAAFISLILVAQTIQDSLKFLVDVVKRALHL